jgi:hypothetical protein
MKHPSHFRVDQWRQFDGVSDVGHQLSHQSRPLLGENIVHHDVQISFLSRLVDGQRRTNHTFQEMQHTLHHTTLSREGVQDADAELNVRAC